ncbi:MAG: hypothetical protein H5U37_01990 [Caldisericia bacterium]|nr:hypothetical protein [Caldisericia bacterium]
MKKFFSIFIIFFLIFTLQIVSVSANNLREVKFTPVTPNIDNLINNASAKWEITVDNSQGNLLISGDRIYIEFPSGFDLTYSRFVSLIPITASGISASGSGVVIGGTQIIIPVTSNQTSLGSFKILIENVRNPPTPSGTYMGRVWTTTSTGVVLDGPTFSQPILIVSQPQYQPPPVVARVEIIPSFVNLNVGSSQLFIAKAYDSFGNLLTNVNFYWSVIPGTGNGIINQNGYFTLTSFGSVTVKCEISGTQVFSYAYVNSYYPYPYPYYPYPYFINNLVITPNNINLTPGSSQTFTAQAYDSLGNPVPDLTYIWTITPLSSGTFTFSPDTKNLYFTLGSYTGVVTIKCEVAGVGIYNFAYINSLTPPLYIDKIVITPSNVTLSYSNPTQTFKAVAYDSSGNVLSNITFNWTITPSVSGNLIVNPTDTSLATFYLNPSFSGSAVISCTTSYGTPPKVISGNALISTTYLPYPPYYPYVNTIVITPQSTTMGLGETKSFTAQAYNNFGNPIYGINYNWSIVSGNGYITPFSTSQTINFTLTGLSPVTLKCEVPSLGLVGYAYINSYITPSPPVSGVTVSVYPPKAGYVASYFISFNISSYSLDLGDYILITFPNDTYLPSFIPPQYITINGVQLNSYPIIYLSSRSILLYLPTTIPPNGKVDISFSYFSNIRNPSSPGSYTLLVTHNKLPNPVVSNPYVID